MLNFSIPAPMLAAVLPCAAKHDVRYYLNAVHIDYTPKRARVVATDGGILAVCRGPIAVTEGDAAVNNRITIPRDLIESALKTKCASVEVRIGEPEQDGRQPVVVSAGNQSRTGLAVDRAYPDYEAAFSAFRSDEQSNATRLVPANLATLAACAKAFKGATLELQAQAEPASPVRWQLSNLPDGYAVAGVVMPVKPKYGRVAEAV